MALKITDENFDEYLNAGMPLVVDFWAEWCGPCRTIAPAIEELSQQYQGKVNIGKLDVDANPNICTTYGIMSIPTILFFKDGKLVDKNVGLMPKNKLDEKIRNVL